jgi:glycerate 2-kinase
LPLTILISPDSFKGSLSAHEAADAIEQGVLQAVPGAFIIKHPISDGGEGLVNVVTPALGGRFMTTDVSGPLEGQRVKARWGISADGSIAVIEMAEAAGLSLVPHNRRDPKVTTTYGVGELIRAALDARVSSIIIGIGGSATNDGGAGMAEALGIKFLDGSGTPIGQGGAALAKVAQIDLRNRDPRLDQVKISVACDVQNRLCGADGASAVYAPQKGASAADVTLLDKALERLGKLVQSSMHLDILEIPGGGAAGGLGAGLVAFCGARLQSGIELVLQVTKYDESLRKSDLVITGEGKIDRQVRFGKALSGLIQCAKRQRVPVIAVVGDVEGDRGSFVGPDFLTDLESLVDSQTSAADAIEHASELVSEKTKLLIQRYLSRT